MRRGARRLTVAVLIATCTVGCQRWGPTDPVGDWTQPSRVRATLENGSRLELENATIISDSLSGWSRTAQDTVRVALAGLTRLEVRKVNWVTTGLLIGAAALTVAIAIDCENRPSADASVYSCD